MLTAMMELGSKRIVHGLTFIAKFVVSRCAFNFENFEGILGFSVPSIIVVKAGLMQITM